MFTISKEADERNAQNNAKQIKIFENFLAEPEAAQAVAQAARQAQAAQAPAKQGGKQ